MAEFIVLALFPGLMIFSALSDLFTMTIPNKVSLLLIGGFFILAFLLNLSWPVIGMHLLSGLCMLGICIFFFAMGWMGGGDAKLAASVALWFGFGGLMDFAVITAIGGGILTFFLFCFHLVDLPPWARSQQWIVRLHGLKAGIPYGVALAAAGLFVYPQTEIWKAFLKVG